MKEINSSMAQKVITSDRFKELLAKARASAVAKKEEDIEAAASTLEVSMNERGVTEVDLRGTGMEVKKKGELSEEASDILKDMLSSFGRNATSSTVPHSNNPTFVDTSSDTASDNKAGRVIGVAKKVTLNQKQQLFNDTVLNGEDCILIGAAGTGKTTSMRTVTRNAIDSNMFPALQSSTQHLAIGGPGAVILSFTRKAVNNIRHAVVEELKKHTLTMHKLLEFAPIFYETEDKKNGGFRTTMKFEPTRNAVNPLPKELKFVAFEESSMIAVELYELLQAAMPHQHQEVFLGDIQQLPPIFGMAILGFKMLKLKVIELDEVYRQAKDSPIISLAWDILSGDKSKFSPKSEKYKITDPKSGKVVERIRVPSLEAMSRTVKLKDENGVETGETSTVKFQIWQKPLSVDHALMTAVKQFCIWEEQGYYNPERDVILCPFNKALGTLELNKGIAGYLGRKRNALVHEIIAGFNKHYLAVGDRVLFDKEDAYITSIAKNGRFLGNQQPQPPHNKMDRYGHVALDELTDAEKLLRNIALNEDDDMSLEAIESFMDSVAEGSEDRVQAASHVIEIKYAYAGEDDPPVVLDSASEINNLLGGYVITGHKFQGSEEECIFLLLHQSHAVMISREMLYTMVTRAKKFLHIICEKDTFFKGVASQRIKGNTIAEKAEFFMGKATDWEKRQEKLKLEQEGNRVGNYN